MQDLVTFYSIFAAEIAFRGLDGCMTKQELNLLKFSPAAVAQLRTGSPQVVRCDMFQARSLTAGLDHGWAVVDLIGKGGHIRTVPIPAWVKAALDQWMMAARVTEGRIFRAVARGGTVWGKGISQNVVWYRTIGVFQDFGAFVCAQPIAGAKPELLDTFHSADPRSQFGTQ